MPLNQGNFFDAELRNCYARLDHSGDPLTRLETFVSWNDLRGVLAAFEFTPGKKGGRPGHDRVMMAKIMILQSLYNLSDGACEYQINDRLSFKRFLGLGVSEKSPDEKSIWLWRERFKHGGYDTKIFAWFETCLTKAGYEARGGQITDAAFVETHKPTNKHKKQLKQEIPLTEHQAAQRDDDATFTKKGGVSYYGYKNHITIDAAHKFIRRACVTTAKTHDSQPFDGLLGDGNEGEHGRTVYADSAYRSEDTEKRLQERGLNSDIHERSYRNTPLTDAQIAENTRRSKTRARVEHIFGHMTTAMGGRMIHTLGIARAAVNITFKNIAYNMQRFAMLQSRKQRNSCA